MEGRDFFRSQSKGVNLTEWKKGSGLRKEQTSQRLFNSAPEAKDEDRSQAREKCFPELKTEVHPAERVLRTQRGYWSDSPKGGPAKESQNQRNIPRQKPVKDLTRPTKGRSEGPGDQRYDREWWDPRANLNRFSCDD